MTSSAKQPDVCVDRIAKLSTPLSEMASLSPLVQLLTLAYQVKIPPRSKQERLVTLLNTLVSSSLSPSKSPSDHETLLGSYIRFLSPVLNGFAGMEEFETAVDAFSEPGEFREFWDLEGGNLITEFVEDGSERLVRGSDIPFVDKFVRDQRCRIGLTEEKGMLVLVPGECKTGDGVWEAPNSEGLRLRREAGETWDDIGSVHVDPSVLL